MTGRPFTLAARLACTPTLHAYPARLDYFI
jgi:hypothetical protein